MNPRQERLQKLQNRILDISKRLGLSHISSCLSVLPILDEIYSIKKPDDLVLLDNAHSHLSHLVVMEEYGIIENAEELRKEFGTHCDTRCGCVINGGSLGHMGGVGIGLALSNKKRDIYVIFSDGSIQEGSNWEALRLKQELKLDNIKCYFNFNGYTALATINLFKLRDRVLVFCPDAIINFSKNGDGYDGIQGHYCKAL
jgi:transketolase